MIEFFVIYTQKTSPQYFLIMEKSNYRTNAPFYYVVLDDQYRHSRPVSGKFFPTIKLNHNIFKAKPQI